MAWKPDFTKANPYEGMPDDYPARVAEVFVPTEETPISPIEAAVERGWLDPSVLIIEPEPPAPPPIVPPPEVPMPPAPTGWIGNIFSLVWDASDWFYSAYSEVSGWWWPFNYLAAPFLGIYRILRSLLTPIAHFWEWADDVAKKVSQGFDLAQITAYFRTWLDYAADAWDWVRNAWWNVWNIVESWWSSTRYTVLAWIDDKVSEVRTLLDQANTWLATLQAYWDSIVGKIPTWDAVVAWWSNWGGNVLAVITGWWPGALLGVAGLINSAFTERESWWAGWQDFRDKVAEFFADPLEFLWTLFTDWFLGPEE